MGYEKGTSVIKILDGATNYLKMKNYVMFEDNWITEYDKTIYDKNGESFSVLDFQEVEENTLMMPDIIPYLNGWVIRKFSCVKLDKNVNVGDILYTVKYIKK